MTLTPKDLKNKNQCDGVDLLNPTDPGPGSSIKNKQ